MFFILPLFLSQDGMGSFCKLVDFICHSGGRRESGGNRKYVFGLPVRHMAPFGADDAVFGF